MAIHWQCLAVSYMCCRICCISLFDVTVISQIALKHPAFHTHSLRVPYSGKQIHVAPASKSESNEHQVLCLLVSNQAGAREISHMMFNAPGVNFALVNPATYSGCTVFGVSIRVESGSLRRLWHWLFSSQDTLLACGLLGFALHGGTFLWLGDPTTSARHGQFKFCGIFQFLDYIFRFIACSLSYF